MHPHNCRCSKFAHHSGYQVLRLIMPSDISHWYAEVEYKFLQIILFFVKTKYILQIIIQVRTYVSMRIFLFQKKKRIQGKSVDPDSQEPANFL